MTYTRTLAVARCRRPGRVHIGTSGWSYHHWRLGLYAGIPRSRWLARYAAHFQAVEINASFHHQLRLTTLARWRDVTPDSFRFAVKVNRCLTHVKRLQFDDKTLRHLDNTDAGHAARDAMRLADLVGEPPGKEECAHHPH